MRRLAATDQEVLNPTENILAVERLTHTLKENAAEDHELYYKIARATFRGVRLHLAPLTSMDVCLHLSHAACQCCVALLPLTFPLCCPSFLLPTGVTHPLPVHADPACHDN